MHVSLRRDVTVSFDPAILVDPHIEGWSARAI